MPEDAIVPRHPEVEVSLDADNAFAMIAAVARALRRAGVSAEERAEFSEEARAGDYDELIRTIQSWVTVV